ncbi:MAG: ABC transporter substrate-binding protein [Oscillospiraceae bacterium]|nr:ABC transporter substrate-binding protein [Oscillospiraceae bacterium]
MKTKRLLALALVSVMLFAFMAACGGGDTSPEDSNPPGENTPSSNDTSAPPPSADSGDTTDIPRNEALYFNGFQWGPSVGWNAFSSNMNNPLAFEQTADGARLPMMETPYMYNFLDNKMYPLLADGGVDGYSFNADRTELTYTLKSAAKWNDGSAVTAHDAAFTWEASVNYLPDGYANWTPYIADVVAADDSTVVIKAVVENGKPVNANMMIQYLGERYILNKAWLEALIDRNGGDKDSIANDKGQDCVYSGAYGPFFMDDNKVILTRNDSYWGQDASMWGKLPAPKYIGNVLYESNAAGDSVFVVGEVDVSQNYIENSYKMWTEQGLPVSTYLADAPYHIAANMPTAYFNMNSPKVGLDDPIVRKAIAISVDYDMILANAMTNQSPSFKDVPRSLMNPSAAEQAMYNKADVAALQWVGNDIDGANAMLDAAGYAIGDSGYREKDGEKLSYKVSCPTGWSDWEAAMYVVAAAGEKIGIEMETYFTDWSVYQVTMTSASQTEFDIFMFSTQGNAPAQPYSRIRALLSSEFNNLDNNWTGNFGQYSNSEVDDILKLIPQETDAAKLREYYTKLVEIYLTEVPSFSLMYRPEKFHTVNESVWTGFTSSDDGRNVPPNNSISGYGIADLYNLTLVG